MANEFIIKNGYFSQGNSNITGSLIVTDGITGSLQGTASYAINAATASYFITGSVTSASFAQTASYVVTAQTASYFITSSVTSASFASTASYVTPLTQSVLISGSLTVTGSINITSNSIYKQDGQNVIYIAKGTDSVYANTIAGANAGNSSSFRQTAYGYQSGYQNSGSNQTAVGYSAGYLNSGSSQTAIGLNAGYLNSGSNQTAVGVSAGRENSTTNQTAIGASAGYLNSGSSQTALGVQAGQYNSGSNQTAVGYLAGYLNSGNNQTALGVQAGQYNSGSNQTAVGYLAGYLNSGSNQVALGQNAGRENTGSNQTAIGRGSGFQNLGSSQTAVGTNAGYINSGSNQTAVGVNAGYLNSGSDNTNIGYNAGVYVTSNGVLPYNSQSAQSVFLGSQTLAGGTNRTNQIVIGYGASGIGSNSVVLGNSSILTTALRGNVGIGTTSPTASLHITNTSLSASFLVEDSTNPDTTPFVITDIGNVGIGKTNPIAKLDVNGDTIITGSLTVSVGGVKGITLDTDTSAGNSEKSSRLLFSQQDPNRSSAIFAISGGMYFSTLASFNVSSGTTRLYISESGNIGIGTTSPSRKLSVNGVLGVQFNDATELMYVNPTATGVDFTIKNTSSISEFRVDTRTGQKFAYYNGGNFAIGSTTDDGINKLQVIGSARITNGLVVTGSLTVTNGITGSLFGTASWANNSVTASYFLTSSVTSASFSTNSTNATTASYIVTAQTASYILNAVSSSYSLSSSFTTNSVTASYYIETDPVFISKSGSLATTGSNTFSGSQTINGNLTVIGTASFNYTTASIIQVGANIITLNTNNPATRFGGITVIDSGSFGNASTGSMLWDSQNNRWVYSNPSGSTYDGGMLISGPRNTSGLGNEDGVLNNFLTVGQGSDHITSSAIFHSGSITQVTGSLLVTNGITGSLFGTASWANNAITASYIVTAQTASYILNAVSASRAATASYFFTSSVSTASYVANAFTQGGNSFGTTATIGTNDTQRLDIETNSQIRLQVFNDGNIRVQPSASMRPFMDGMYIDVHPEATNQAIVPYLGNDIAYNTLRGGTFTGTPGSGSTYVTSTATIEAIFDGAPTYAGISSNTTQLSGSYTASIVFPQSYQFTNTIGVSFGNPSWRAKDFTVEILVTGSYYVIDTVTNWAYANYNKAFSTSNNNLQGARITFSNFNSSLFRIADIFLLNYNGRYGKEIYLGKDGGQIYKGITVTGSVVSTTGFTGSLQGTSSWANNAITASFITTAQTASYFITSSVTSASFASNSISSSFSQIAATASYFFTSSVTSASFATNSATASYILNAVSSSYSNTSSYAVNSVTASYVNPLIQNVIITGSLSNGFNNQSSGISSHAEGYYTTASGDYSYANGNSTIASGSYQSVVGEYNIASSISSAFIIGNGKLGTRSNLVFASGTKFQVTGSVIATAGFTGSLQGTSSWANNSITASFITTAQTASFVSWANVNETTTDTFLGTSSFATSASRASTASYFFTSSVTSASFATNSTNAATASYIVLAQTASYVVTAQTASYILNAVSASRSQTASFVTPLTQNAQITGSLTVTGGITGSLFGTASWALNAITASFATNSTTTLFSQTASYVNPLNQNVIITGSLNTGNTNLASGQYSHAEGQNTTTIGQYSHAEGLNTIASGSYSHAEGLNTIASGDYSHAEGYSLNGDEAGPVHASGYASHAEGYSTRAEGTGSHAEGLNTIASGNYSHAEGAVTIASGSYSHAEGYSTRAIGDGSHAAGNYTIASGSYQSVIGQYNRSSSAESAFIIGNGTSNTSRSNLVFASGSTFQVTGSIIATNGITGSFSGDGSGLTGLVVDSVNIGNTNLTITADTRRVLSHSGTSKFIISGSTSTNAALEIESTSTGNSRILVMRQQLNGESTKYAQRSITTGGDSLDSSEFNGWSTDSIFEATGSSTPVPPNKLKGFQWAIFNGTDYTIPLNISSSGAVGIGTTTPIAKLQVGDVTANSNLLYRGLILQGGYSTTAQRQQNLMTFSALGSPYINSNPFNDNINGNDRNWHIGSVSDVDYFQSPRFSFIVSGSEKLNILQNGNVGIGTTTPTQKLTVATGSITADNYYFNNQNTTVAQRVSSTVSGISNAGYTTICNVVGDSLASGIRISLMGTTSTVVVNTVADILVNHSTDIYIESKSGIYTILTLKVISDNNQSFTIQATSDSANAVTLNVEVFPLNSETITFNPAGIYTGATLIHPCVPGLNISATGGDASTNGNLSVSGRVGIGTTSAAVKLNVSGSVNIASGLNNASARPGVSSGTLTAGEIRGYSSGVGVTGDDGFVRVSAGGGTTRLTKSYIDISGYSTIPDMDKNIVFGTSGDPRMRIDATGNVLIGPDGSSLKAFVNIYGSKTYSIGAYGYLATTGTGTLGGTTAPFSLYCNNRIEAAEFDATSDERLKDVIGEIELTDALNLINNVKAIKYTWKVSDDKGIKTGYSAQQVEKSGFRHLIGHIPNENLTASTDSDGFTSPDGFQLTMNYDQVTPYHGVVIKNLLERIEKLEETIKLLTQ